METVGKVKFETSKITPSSFSPLVLLVTPHSLVAHNPLKSPHLSRINLMTNIYTYISPWIRDVVNCLVLGLTIGPSGRCVSLGLGSWRFMSAGLVSLLGREEFALHWRCCHASLFAATSFGAIILISWTVVQRQGNSLSPLRTLAIQ